MLKRVLVLSATVVLMFLAIVALMRMTTTPLAAAQAYVYTSPRDGARFVQSGTTIAIRYAETVDPATVEGQFVVTGSQSGTHHGVVRVADDGRTIIFVPTDEFARGEVVRVQVRDGIVSAETTRLSGGEFAFTVAATVAPQPTLFEQIVDGASTPSATPNRAPMTATTDLKTVPADFPPLIVTVPASGTGEGGIFLTNFTVDWQRFSFSDSKSYLLILDNNGEPIFYQRMTPGVPYFDFKKQPNGYLSYNEGNGPGFYVMNEQYEVIDLFSVGNGYPRTDNHDFQMLPNGHAILMIYDRQPVDMSQIVPDGDPNAIVIGLVLQELDTEKNVVFEWRSWDHIPITDTTVDLTTDEVDYVHGNSVDVDHDGNWLISSRYLDEVTKIDRETGEIIWRLGGKQNMFTFQPAGGEPFFDQHDARRIANGNLTLFDNRAADDSTYARAVEYELDEENFIARRVWEYRQDAPGGAVAMGSAQRLANDNTLIGWGTMYPSVTEARMDGTVAFELTFGQYVTPTMTRNSYRAFRDVWEGDPQWPPVLVASQTMSDALQLNYSWNGATNVISYNVYAGETLDDMHLFETTLKDGFETVTVIDTPGADCVYQIEPVDVDGTPMMRSNIVLAPHCIVSQLLMPILVQD